MNEVQDFVKNFANSEGQNKDINNFFSGKLELIANNPESNLKIIKSLDPAKHTQVLTWLLYALLTGKPLLMKLQQSKFDISNPTLILELFSNFLLHFNLKH
jgi:hypothetical protein